MAMKKRRLFGVSIDSCPSRDKAEAWARAVWRANAIVFYDCGMLHGAGPCWWFEVI